MENTLVYTIKDRCRVCYTCVRECPAKAIKIINGQAEVIAERCIACGNCTRVCSQGAKAFKDSTARVFDILGSGEEVFALVAPSFIAEFSEFDDHRSFVYLLRKLGFSKVFEVGFGADLVANEYEKLMGQDSMKGWISSDCPAIVSFIEKYNPELTGNLAPVVSPMIALARFLRKKYGSSYKSVFIGPCIAKKAGTNEIDEKLTFLEIRNMLLEKGILMSGEGKSEFDPPLSGKGALFPVSRGLLQTINLPEEDMERNVIVAEGRDNFQEAIREYKLGAISSQHLELLCCEGCIMGPGTSKNGNKYSRRLRVMNYVKSKLENFYEESWEADIKEAEGIDFSQDFLLDDQRIEEPSEKKIREVLKTMNKYAEKDHLNCGACGYDTCRKHAIAIISGLAENEMCLPYSIEKLHNSVYELALSNEKLFNVQQVLKQTEKLAHMGQLSAGIAHELNNPLGVVIMYSNLLYEELEDDSPLKKDLSLIVEQAQRCKTIVGGLLNFARKNQVNYSEVNINEMIRISVGSVLKPDNVSVEIRSSMKDPFAELDQEQMIQVISNLIKNGIEAMPGGGRITIMLEDNDNEIILKIKDSGTGIKESDLQKVFEPFFTTKGIGKGTGLGLATAYGVVKMHRGKIKVDSNANPENGVTGTTFTIKLPRRSLF